MLQAVSGSVPARIGKTSSCGVNPICSRLRFFFMDDEQVNVESALKAGFQAIQYQL